MAKMINVTMLSGYMYCARKLYLEHVLKLAEPPKEALVLGSLRHEVYELINDAEEGIVKGLKQKAALEDVQGIYARHHSAILRKVVTSNKAILSEFNLEPKEVFRKNWPLVMQESQKRANNVFSFMQRTGLSGNELWEKLMPKLVSEFSISSESLGLKGRIDQVEMYENFIIPIELKTGKSPNDGAWPGHRIQLLTYMLMLSEKTASSDSGKEVREGRIIYLDSDRTVSFSPNPFAEKEVKELVSRINALLNSDKLPDFCGNDNKCSACGLRESCHDEAMLRKRQEQGLKAG